MAPVFSEFCQVVVMKSRGVSDKRELKYAAVTMNANNMELSFPNQLFINNNFVDSESGDTFDSINPSDESLICKVSTE